MQSRELAEHTATPYRWSRVVKSKGREVMRISQIGWVKVRLPGRDEEMTMIVARSGGNDVSFMLLTNLAVENIACRMRHAILLSPIGM